MVCPNENRSRQCTGVSETEPLGSSGMSSASFPLSYEEIDAAGNDINAGDNGPEPFRYFLPTEVAVHNTQRDCWVSYNGGVYDLTDLCQTWANTRQIRPILAHAGKDISHWFDHETNDIRYHVHPVTGTMVPYCPHGPIPDVIPSVVPNSSWRPLDKCPWWLLGKYKIGYLTKSPRPIRILNVLTGTQVVLMVCEEDSVRRIQERALIYNANGMSYEWKFEGKRLNLDWTLAENRVPDERDRFVACGLPEDYHVPCLMCYFNDTQIPFSPGDARNNKGRENRTETGN